MDDRERHWAQGMRDALAGNQQAYEQLLRELAPALRAAVRRRFSSIGLGTGESEDVVQEILLAVHLKRHTWRSSDPLGPWLWTIARNKFVDHLRRRGRRVEVPIEDFAEILPAEEQRPGPDAPDVQRHLATLPPRQRDVLTSIAVEGASVGETASRLGLTPGAVRVNLHRAFARLADRLRGEDIE